MQGADSNYLVNFATCLKPARPLRELLPREVSSGTKHRLVAIAMSQRVRAHTPPLTPAPSPTDAPISADADHQLERIGVIGTHSRRACVNESQFLCDHSGSSNGTPDFFGPAGLRRTQSRSDDLGLGERQRQNETAIVTAIKEASSGIRRQRCENVRGRLRSTGGVEANGRTCVCRAHVAPGALPSVDHPWLTILRPQSRRV